MDLPCFSGCCANSTWSCGWIWPSLTTPHLAGCFQGFPCWSVYRDFILWLCTGCVTYTFVYMVRSQVCPGRPEVNIGCLPLLFSTLIFEARSLPSALIWSSPIRLPVYPSPCFCAGITNACCCLWLSHAYWESKPRRLRLYVQRALYWLSSPPNPNPVFLFRWFHLYADFSFFLKFFIRCGCYIMNISVLWTYVLS